MEKNDLKKVYEQMDELSSRIKDSSTKKELDKEIQKQKDSLDKKKVEN